MAAEGRNRELDWLRAYAVLLVLAEHAGLVRPYDTAWSRIVHSWYEGRTGVDLFFVISGFVISETFLPPFDAALRHGFRSALHRAVAFTIRRVIRLWPTAAAWSILTLLASLAFAGTAAFPAPIVCFRKSVAALLYFSNWSEVGAPSQIGYFYSLATEMQFYLLLPLVLFLVRGRDRRLMLAAAMFLLGCIGCFGLDAQPQLRFGGIVAGVALHFAVRSGRLAALEPATLRRPGRAAAFTAATLLALATCELPFGGFGADGSHVAAMVACLLVGAASFRRGYVSPLGVPGLLDWIASRSYSIYVSHIPTLLLCRCLLYAYERRGEAMLAAPLVPDALTLLLPAGAVVACAEITFRFLERPSLMRARATGGSPGAEERPAPPRANLGQALAPALP